MQTGRQSVFSLGERRALLDFLWRPQLERALGLKELDREYLGLPACESVTSFLEAVFDQWHVRIDIESDDLAKVPREGSVVVVSNHPFGGIEGMALALLLLTVRPDVKILANFMLGRIPELASERDRSVVVRPQHTVAALVTEQQVVVDRRRHSPCEKCLHEAALRLHVDPGRHNCRGMLDAQFGGRLTRPGRRQRYE